MYPFLLLHVTNDNFLQAKDGQEELTIWRDWHNEGVGSKL